MINLMEAKSLAQLAYEMRKTALEMSYNCGEPTHLGGALSIIDVMAVLYGKILKKDNRFILSKGHGVLALFSALFCTGKLSKKDIITFQKNGSKYIAHPIMNTKVGIESSNGSLGQGLSMGVGIALSYKKRNKKGKVYVLVGDGECYEGSIWEAVISAEEFNLDNLVVIVDCNGFQNDGAISKSMNSSSMLKKWKGFNWDCIKCDGHNIKKLITSIEKPSKILPKVIIAETIKGKGVNFMENNNDWHHNRLSNRLFQEAINGLNEAWLS